MNITMSTRAKGKNAPEPESEVEGSKSICAADLELLDQQRLVLPYVLMYKSLITPMSCCQTQEVFGAMHAEHSKG